MKPPRQRAALPGFGHIGRWKFGHYQLRGLERWRVEEAVFGDVRRLSEPRLREAARGVAAELMSRRLRRPWLMRWGGWMFTGIGLAVTTLGLVAHYVSHRPGELAIIYLAYGLVGVVLGAAGIMLGPKQMRRKLERVVRLNDEQANNRSPAP